MSEKICLITGVGPGTGAAMTRRFAAGGYHVAMIARNTERLSALEAEIDGATGYACDVSDEAAVSQTLEQISSDLGQPNVFIHNAVAATFGNFMEIEPRDFNQHFQVNAMGLLYFARALAPKMIEAGEGVIMATGNTSALRGKANFASFAPTKAAQRILAESIARELGPKGVHVAYVVIDAVIDLDWTRKMMPDKPDDFFIQPSAIAETVFNVAHQDRSAWSFNVEVRPFGEVW